MLCYMNFLVLGLVDQNIAVVVYQILSFQFECYVWVAPLVVCQSMSGKLVVHHSMSCCLLGREVALVGNNFGCCFVCEVVAIVDVSGRC